AVSAWSGSRSRPSLTLLGRPSRRLENEAVGEQGMFLGEPPASEAADVAFEDDRTSDGYVNNLTRLWCWRPDIYNAFSALQGGLTQASALTKRDRAVLVTTSAAERHDAYCSLAWGR